MRESQKARARQTWSADRRGLSPRASLTPYSHQSHFQFLRSLQAFPSKTALWYTTYNAEKYGLFFNVVYFWFGCCEWNSSPTVHTLSDWKPRSPKSKRDKNSSRWWFEVGKTLTPDNELTSLIFAVVFGIVTHSFHLFNVFFVLFVGVH